MAAASVAIPVPVPAYEQRAAIPGLSLPESKAIAKTLVPAALGGGLSLGVIAATYPRHGVLAGMLMMVTGGLLAGTAPLLSIPQEMGLGAFVASAGWLLERAVGEINTPTATQAGAVVLPPVTLPDGTQVTFTRGVAA